MFKYFWEHNGHIWVSYQPKSYWITHSFEKHNYILHCCALLVLTVYVCIRCCYLNKCLYNQRVIMQIRNFWKLCSPLLNLRARSIHLYWKVFICVINVILMNMSLNIYIYMYPVSHIDNGPDISQWMFQFAMSSDSWDIHWRTVITNITVPSDHYIYSALSAPWI